jgi:hypothetical protein
LAISEQRLRGEEKKASFIGGKPQPPFPQEVGKDEKKMTMTMKKRTNQSPLTVDEIVDKLLAMRKQEETSYCYRNYLPKKGDGSQARLNLTWREKICQWSYNVVDQ